MKNLIYAKIEDLGGGAIFSAHSDDTEDLLKRIHDDTLPAFSDPNISAGKLIPALTLNGKIRLIPRGNRVVIGHKDSFGKIHGFTKGNICTI